MRCNVQWRLFSCVFYLSLYCGHAKGQTKAILEDSLNNHPRGEGFIHSNLPGFYYYDYYEGQAFNFTCRKIAGTYIQLSFSGNVQTGLQDIPVSLYVKLTRADDGKSLLCSVYDSHYRHQNPEHVTLMFRLRNNTGLLAFQVNGMIPLKTNTNNVYEYFYEYKYFHGEIISTNLMTDRGKFTHANCGVYGSPQQVLIDYFSRALQTQYADIPTMNFHSNNSGTYIHCIMALATNPYTTYHVKITFTSTTVDYSPYIAGLQMSNILLQYWNGSNVIEYEIDDQELRLRCLSNNNMREGGFTFNNWEVVSSNTVIHGLRPGVERADVRCEVESEPTTVLRLVRKKRSFGNWEMSPTMSGNGWKPMPSICPAELICTSIDYCTKDGMRSDQVVVLTEAEKVKRTPLSECSENGNAGVCCRRTNTIFQGFVPIDSAPEYPMNVIPLNPDPSSTFSAPLDVSSVTPPVTRVPATTSTAPTPSTISSTLSTSLVADTSTTTVASVGSNSSQDDGVGGSLLIACSVILVVLIVAGALALGIHFKKRKMIKCNSDMEYETLPEHHEGPMATPSQWNQPDDVTYSHAVHENLYTTPIPKILRMKNNELTGSLNQPIPNGTYQNVGIDATNRAITENNDYAYASIQNSEPTYASVEINAPTYASVQKHSQEKSKHDVTEYQNVNPYNAEVSYAQALMNNRNVEEIDIAKTLYGNIISTSHYQNVPPSNTSHT